MAQIFKGRVYGGSPYPSAEINYEYKRDNANMLYRFTGRVYLENANGWYYNNIQLNLYLNGSWIYGKDCKSSSNGWSFDFDSGWKTVENKTSGTTPFSFTVKDTQNSGWCNYTSGTYNLTVAPAYANITSFTVSKRDETSLQVGYGVDVACDYARYSLDNTNWYDLPSNGVVSGLKANTKYTLYLALRRTDSQLWSYSNGVSQTTYDYPHCTDTPNFNIGNSVTITLYNPLKRTVNVAFIGDTDTVLGNSDTNGTSITGYNYTDFNNSLYATIPNKQSGKYKIRVTYGSSVRTRNNGNTYSIVGNEVPSFSNFTFRDTNTAVTNVIGTDQALVKGLSNLEITIPSANKMVAVKSANPKSYTLTIDDISKSVDYSTNNISVQMGAINSSGTRRITVRAYDSRELSTPVHKDIPIWDYYKPVINIDVSRLNNFETQTTLKVNGTYTKMYDGVKDLNSMTKVQYRYREVGGTWSNWTTLNTTVSSGKFTCSDVIISLDNTKSFEVEVQAEDKLQPNTAKGTVGVGQAIFFVSSNKKACYINGQQILTYDVINEW